MERLTSKDCPPGLSGVAITDMRAQKLWELENDIEAGRLVRVPKVGDTVYMPFEGKILFGKITDISCPWEKSVSFVAQTEEEQECTGTWMLHVFPTEQAARAAKEDGNA